MADEQDNPSENTADTQQSTSDKPESSLSDKVASKAMSLGKAMKAGASKAMNVHQAMSNASKSKEGDPKSGKSSDDLQNAYQDIMDMLEKLIEDLQDIYKVAVPGAFNAAKAAGGKVLDGASFVGGKAMDAASTLMSSNDKQEPQSADDLVKSYADKHEAVPSPDSSDEQKSSPDQGLSDDGLGNDKDSLPDMSPSTQDSANADDFVQSYADELQALPEHSASEQPNPEPDEGLDNNGPGFQPGS